MQMKSLSHQYFAAHITSRKGETMKLQVNTFKMFTNSDYCSEMLHETRLVVRLPTSVLYGVGVFQSEFSRARAASRRAPYGGTCVNE
jgi:hypothetical protein